MLKAFAVLLLTSSCLGYRILGYFPIPVHSHHNTFAPIILELARRGHQVVYLTPIPPPTDHPNIDVRIIRNFKNEFLGTLNLPVLGVSPVPVMSHMFSTTGLELAEQFYGDPEAQRLIHGSESFDAVLVESHFAQEPASALIHKFGCVGIEVAALGDLAWINEISGLPDNSAYQVDFKLDFSDSMTLMERLHNLYSTWSTTLVSYYYLWRMQSVMDKYFNYTGWESRPPINKLISNRSMILINRDVVLGYPYPQAPHVKDIGGINIVPNKPLPKEIQKFMDESTNGVIYFSMGSNLNTSEIATGKFGDAFMSVFRNLPQNVIMKWENERPRTLPSNVMTYKWLPQQDILAHNNCVLFVTHGGFNSLEESVYYGVPVLGIPFFGDQPKNVRQVESAGYGIRLQFENVSTTSVSWSINELLNNQRYKKEAERRSRMIRERIRPAVQEAAYWVEFAIKYPNTLTPRAAYLSFIQLYMIDLKLIILAFILFAYKFIVYLFTQCTINQAKNKVKIS